MDELVSGLVFLRLMVLYYLMCVLVEVLSLLCSSGASIMNAQ